MIDKLFSHLVLLLHLFFLIIFHNIHFYMFSLSISSFILSSFRCLPLPFISSNALPDRLWVHTASYLKGTRDKAAGALSWPFISNQAEDTYSTTDVSRPVSSCQAHIWDPQQIFFLSFLITLRQLRVCWSGASSLTKGLISSSQLLLGIASAVFLEYESHGTHEHILLSLFFRLPQLEGQVPKCISLRNRVDQLYPQVLSLSPSSADANNIWIYTSTAPYVFME
jgi:hypothetical protein